MTDSREQVAIVGGGLAGSLLAIALARRGLHPRVFERRQKYGEPVAHGGRSINLALAARGLHALDRFDLRPKIEPMLLPMRGRMLHDRDGATQLIAYGQREHEVIYSISRSGLNDALYEIASDRYGIEYRFDSGCSGIDDEGLWIDGPDGAYVVDTPVLAADGAGSVIRRALTEARLVTSSEELLDHAYKELRIEPLDNGQFALEPGALHIWPRGGFMLIALPNPDRSFTATLFLPSEGDPGFDSLTADNVRSFFEREFADALPFIRSFEEQFSSNPTGQLGTVRCRPWRVADRVLLVGDAAHAIVPFHGQGMNAAFEDIVALDELIDEHGPDWSVVFDRFNASRQPQADAIADMALENYIEMRDSVRRPDFHLKKHLELELERRFPDAFVPRYSMVMFHPEIPYSVARERGRIQQGILDRISTGIDSVEAADLELAGRLIAAELSPLPKARN